MPRLPWFLLLSTLLLPACDPSAGGSDDGPDAGATACATAPRAVVDTAQTGCYAATGAAACPAAGAAFYGQDAQHDGLAPRYTVSADGLTVHDERTGLTWQRSPDTTGDGVIDAADKLTWAQAKARPAALSAARFGGHDDWRLPSIEELYSLIEFSGTDPSGLAGNDTSALAPFLDTSAFAFAYGDTAAGERVIDAQYASDTLYVSHTGNDGGGTLFGVNFADGRIKGYGLILNGADKTFFVIAVRGATGYGANALVDEGDGTVTDRATGLQWAKADSGAGMDWEAALAWVQARNAEGYLGHDDWRLPDAKELQGLVDYTRSPDTTGSAAIDPVFESTAITNEAGADDYPYYWTSTTHAAFDGSGGSAVYVAFGRAMGYMNGSWLDVHGAGAQRSGPKAGDPADYPTGHGPQGDAIRIDNYVRLVRDTCLPADAAPVAAFTWSSASPAPADEVRFADASTGDPTGWAWTFTDDGSTSADPTPVHAFALVGTYDVTLTVTGAGGSSTTTRRVTVQTGTAGGGGGGPVSCSAPADCEVAGACPADAAQGCGCETTPDGQRCLPLCSAPSDCPSVDVPLTCGPQGFCVPA